MKRWAAALVVLLALLGLAGLGFEALRGGASAGPPAGGWRTAQVERGPLVSSVVATGAVRPVATVLVGSQISGQIKELKADFNSLVRVGDVIAVIDPASFETAVAQAAAEVDYAEAALLMERAALDRTRAELDGVRAELAAGEAEIAKAQAALTEQVRDLARKSKLVAAGNLSPAERDRAQSAHDSALAGLRQAEAQKQGRAAAVQAIAAQLRAAEARIASAEATLRQKQAALRHAESDLERTLIRAPVDGVVIERAVEAGQTVAASLQAPTLFTIAQDLAEMQIEVAIDEADIGRIREGLPVAFTVDAHPERTFRGSVVQIRLQPQVVEYVVTYTVVVSAPNPDLLLFPGMTANVRVVVDERAQALKVPNAALRFRPAGAPPDAGPGVWLAEPGGPRFVAVRPGLSDGAFTEIAGPLAEGQAVVVGEAPAGERQPRRLRL